jgi:hypothetical protein
VHTTATERETFMLRHLAIALSVLALSLTSAPAAEQKNQTAVDRALQQASEGNAVFAEFLLGTASVRETAAQQQLLARLDDWLAANFELARESALPKIAFASPAQIAALRYKGLAAASADVTGFIPRTALERTTVALYLDAEKTIYLPDDWTGGSPAELSVLVHETVHHLQNLSGTHYECLRAREQLAYAAQDKFLQMFGRDLAGEFDVNPFTVLVRSTCAY